MRVSIFVAVLALAAFATAQPSQAAAVLSRLVVQRQDLLAGYSMDGTESATTAQQMTSTFRQTPSPSVVMLTRDGFAGYYWVEFSYGRAGSRRVLVSWVSRFSTAAGAHRFWRWVVQHSEGHTMNSRLPATGNEMATFAQQTVAGPDYTVLFRRNRYVEGMLVHGQRASFGRLASLLRVVDTRILRSG